jgi:hypothetical protein
MQVQLRKLMDIILSSSFHMFAVNIALPAVLPNGRKLGRKTQHFLDFLDENIF